MKTLFSISFLLISISLYSQAPDILWEHTYGGTLNDEAHAMRQTPDGGFILAGTSYSSDLDIPDNYGSRDYCLVKTDAYGNLEWAHNYGGPGTDFCEDVACAYDGGFIAIGYVLVPGGDIPETFGSSDIWLVKTDIDGNLIWQKNYGGAGAEIGECIIQTSDGGYVFSGESSSIDGDVTGQHGSGDVWVVKLDADGNIQWQKCVGGTELDHAYSIDETTDGGFIVLADSYSSDGDVDVNHGEKDYLLCKLDGSGNLEWAHAYGGSGNEWAHSVKQTPDGGYIAAGYTESNDGDVSGNHGTYDVWLIKTDSIGNLEWQKCLGGSAGDYGYDLKIGNDNNFFVTGISGSDDGDVTLHYGSPFLADVWIIQLDIAGEIQWQKTIGGTQSDWGFAFMNLSDGTYVVSGLTGSTDYDVELTHGLQDFWLVKLGFCTESTWYADLDADGYGDLSSDSTTCEMPIGYVADSTDCDDANENIHPGAEDICNAIDDNCNGEIDEDAIFITYYADADGDDYGDADADSTSCSVLTGYVLDSTDCDDTNPAIYPGATEVCNFLDDDCDGYVDDNLAFVWLYLDADNDTYGNASIDTLTCESLMGYVPDSTDCDDTNPNIYPGAPEVFNGLDDDCDGVADEGLSIEENTSLSISLYPNPAQSAITLLFSSIQNEPVQAEIRNNLGEKIRDVQIDDVVTEIDISAIAEGIYFVIIKMEYDFYSMPFFKML